jgi:hypothetical protein
MPVPAPSQLSMWKRALVRIRLNPIAHINELLRPIFTSPASRLVPS